MKKNSSDGMMSFRPKVDMTLIKSLPVWKNDKMSGNVRNKIRLYIMLNLVEEAENGMEWHFSNLPTTKLHHTVKEDEYGNLTCDCQRWRTLELKCAHIYTVEILKMLEKDAESRIDIEEV